MTLGPAGLKPCPTPVAQAFQACGIALVCALAIPACLRQPAANPNVIVVAVASGPNNLDPRIGTDDVSQKAAQLIFNGLMAINEQLRVVPDLA